MVSNIRHDVIPLPGYLVASKLFNIFGIDAYDAGTGTPVGDPIEASAIHAVFGHYRSPKDPLLVGAVKSNIGHLEGASGIAGLIKTIMVLEKGIIPQNACFERVNPNIPMHEWNLEVRINSMRKYEMSAESC